MFDFIHDIFESWILEGASNGLKGYQRSLTLNHLKNCQRCRSFALDLVEFSHAAEAKPNTHKLSGAEEKEIHSRVMAAFHRQRNDERLSQPFRRLSGPLVRPNFVKALAMVVLILGVAVTLSYSFRREPAAGVTATQADTRVGQSTIEPLEVSPTATVNPKIEPRPALTSPPAAKIENR